MVEVSIKELEDICFEAGKLSEQERRIGLSIANLNSIIGDFDMSDEELQKYIDDRNYLQGRLLDVTNKFNEYTEKREKINEKLREICD